MENTDIPVYETVQLHTSDGKTIEVPKWSLGGTYSAAEELTRLHLKGTDYLKFGAVGATGEILVEESSGRIFERHDGALELQLVNTTLEKFRECVREFIDMYPLYGREDDEEFDPVADRFEAIMERVDPNSYQVHSYWYEIKWGIAIGDFATEDL